MRQLKTQGHTTASGGLFSKDYLNHLLSDETLSSTLRLKREPLGVFMSQLENVAKQIEETAAAVSTQSNALVSAAQIASKQMMEVSAKMRDSAEKMSTAMVKFAAIANNTKFAESAKTAESLVNSLERLAELQRTGMLDKVMAAMKHQ